MKRFALGFLKVYKVAVSPYMPGVCRFYPSCSDYAAEAIHKHGTFKGMGMAARRLSRCHPGRTGGYDPVPEPD